ncbi:MAG: glycosyltransferase [bacterium]|nr:glycosyltransferase [bacterium]
MADRPLRVLQLTSTSLMGGAEQMVLHLLRAADPVRVRFEVLSLLGPGDLTRRAAEAGVPAVHWNLAGMGRPWRWPGLWRRMRRFLIRGRFDAVHCYGLRADLAVRWVAAGLGVPVLSSISSPDPWRRAPHVWLDRLTADGVTAWVAVCEAARQTRLRRERFPADRIHVVLNGLPDQAPPTVEARRAARARWRLAPDAPVLAVVGNLRPAKGYPDLIEALAGLRTRVPGLICLAAGRDDSAGALPALARARGLESALKFIGFNEDPSRELLPAADLLVMPSHWEGCPVALLEAMRAGLPSVATRVGGIPELITDGREGLLVPPHAPGALTEALAALLVDPARRAAMGAAARARFLATFTADRMAAELTALYEHYGRIR